MNVKKTWSHHTGPPESGHGSLDELMEKAKSATVRNVAKSTDYLPMTWYTEDGDGAVAAYITDMQGSEQDDRMLAVLKERFRKKHVRRYVYVAESWSAPYRGVSSEIRPSDCPDRTEVVLFVGVERGRRLTVVAEIEQTDSGRQLKTFESCNVYGGWVADMLPLDA